MDKKTIQGLFKAVLIGGDAFFVLVSILLAYNIRFYWKVVPVLYDVPLLKYYLYAAPYVILVYLLAFNYAGLYRFARNISRIDEFYKVFLTTTAVIIILMSTTFLIRNFSYSRIVLITMWLVGIVLIGSWRFVYRNVFRYFKRKELIIQNIIIIGATEISKILISRIQREPNLGYSIIGIVDDKLAKGKKVMGVPVLGKIKSLSIIIKKMNVDEAFLGLSEYNRQNVAEIIMENDKVKFMIVSDVLNIITKNIEFDEFCGLPVFTVKELPLDKMLNRTIKRTFDIVASFFILLVLSPLLIVVAILVKTTSPGPVFYKQERISKNNKLFFMYKFRSMKSGAENKSGPVWARKDDPRRTAFGTFIRKTSIDELPQFLNVFFGNMSVVGPRPERPHFVKQFSKTIPRYMERHKVKAGISGWAAISGLRGNTSIEERVKYDLYYIENWSLWFDIKIIIRTMLELFHHTTAY